MSETLTGVTVVVSLYRAPLDSGYQQMVRSMIERGLLDRGFLVCLHSLCQGNCCICVVIVSCPFHTSEFRYFLFLGTRNLEYSYGLQVVASDYEIDDSAKEEWDGFTGVLGTPRQMRLTSFPTRHFLG